MIILCFRKITPIDLRRRDLNWEKLEKGRLVGCLLKWLPADRTIGAWPRPVGMRSGAD